MRERVSTMQERVQREFGEAPPVMFHYLCVTCKAQCYSVHGELKADRFLRSDDVMPTQIHGTGLGTWHCPVHGKTKVARQRA